MSSRNYLGHLCNGRPKSANTKCYLPPSLAPQPSIAPLLLGTASTQSRSLKQPKCNQKINQMAEERTRNYPTNWKLCAIATETRGNGQNTTTTVSDMLTEKWGYQRNERIRNHCGNGSSPTFCNFCHSVATLRIFLLFWRSSIFVFRRLVPLAIFEKASTFFWSCQKKSNATSSFPEGIMMFYTLTVGEFPAADCSSAARGSA